MWLAGSERWDAYLANSAAGLSGPHGQRHWSEVASERDGWKLVQGWLGEAGGARRLRRRRVRVWLSGALARPFLIGPMPGIRRWSELAQIADGLAPDATGLAGPCALWLDSCGAGQACMAVATERALVEEIVSRSKDARLTLVSIEPWWASVLNEALSRAARPRLLVVEDSEALTILGGENGQFANVATYAPRPTAEQARALLVRAMLSEGIAAANVLRATLQGAAASVASIGPRASPAGFGIHFEALT